MTEQEMKEILEREFSPVHMELIDQSHTHTSDQHAETMKARERLYELTLVSTAFEGLSLLERHQAVYRVLKMGQNDLIHGITIKALTPGQWQA